MKDFSDKVVVITGAGSGIGRALAQAFHARGARLALCDVDAKGLAATAADCGGDASLQAIVDVADEAAVHGFAEQVRGRFGSASVLVNNAGVTVLERAESTSMDDFRWLMDINFWGVVHGCRAFLPLLAEQDDAALVNISSVFGLIAWPTQSAYNASKFAVRGYTECLRLEQAGSGLNVISVHPGGIRTNIARRARFHQDDRGCRDGERFVRQFDQLARTTPERAAQVIIRGIERRRPRVLIGGDAALIDWVQRWMPVRYFAVLDRLFGLQRRGVD